MKERRQKQVVLHCARQYFTFLFIVACTVTLLCPGSASAAKRKSPSSSSSSSSSSSKVSPPNYAEEEEPLIDQIAMESNDNAHQPEAIASVVAPPSKPVGYTGFKINPNCKCGKTSYRNDDGNPQPWTAAIFYKSQGKESSSISPSPVIQYSSGLPTTDPRPSMLLFCTGSLINDRYVLTASRCVQGLNSSDLEVWLSDKSLWTDHDQPLRSLDESKANNALKKIAVEKIIIHPDFSPSTLDHEIALLRLADPVKLSRRRRDDANGESTKRRFYMTPVCLPKYDIMNSLTSEKAKDKTGDTTAKEVAKKKEDNDNGYLDNVKAVVSTWDKKGRTSYSLVQAEVPVVRSINKCLELTNKTAVLNENMLCAGKMEENAVESCSMDTGSPLVIYEDGTSQRNSHQLQERIRLSSPSTRRSGKEDTRGHYTLVGVSSWLYGCTNLTNVNILYDVIFPNNTAKPQVPGVYHRIEKYIDWLTHSTLDAVWCA